MNKIELIRKPVEKELGEFKLLFDDSLKSSTPLLNEVLSYIKKTQRKDDASYFGIIDGKVVCCS